MLERLRCWARVMAHAAHRGRHVAAGFVLGTLFVLWWTHALVSFGATRSILTGLMTSAVIAMALGLLTSGPQPNSTRRAWSWGGLAVWTAILPLTSRLVFRGFALVSADFVSQPSGEFLAALVAGGVVLALPHFGLGRLLRLECGASDHKSSTVIEPHWLGCVAALCLTPAWLLPAWGVPTITLATVLCAVGIGLAALRRPTKLDSIAESDPAMFPPIPLRSWASGPMAFLLAMQGGCLLGIAVLVLSQLWIHGLPTAFAPLAGCWLGWGLSRRWASRVDAAIGPGVGLLGAVVAVLLVGGEPVWTALCLGANSRITSVGWLFGCRILLSLLLTLPVGVVFGIAVRSAGQTPDGTRPWALPLLAGLVGWSLTRWVGVDPRTAAGLAVLIGLAHCLASGLLLKRYWPSTRVRRLSAVVGMGILSATPFWLRQQQPDRAARLLFSAQTSLAARTSSNHELLMALDDARLLRSVWGGDSVWTAWKQRGEIEVWRENGLPQGERSLHLELVPEPPAELLAAALPLTIHPRADDVLVVGLGSGAVLRSALETPVQSLTCWEQDADLLSLVGVTSGDERPAPWSDSRLSVRRTHPAFATAARPTSSYDVIIVNERQFSSWRTLGQGTAEIYSRWRSLLKPNGLLCQRFEYVNYGPQPLLDVTRTLTQVFPQVLLWESAPGEMLLLASTTEQPLIDATMLARFETQQSRRLFGQMGWDCSQPVNIVTISGGELLSAAIQPGTTSTAANAYFEFALPIEAARWGNKSQELQRQLAPLARSALSRLPPDSGQEAMQKRLEDVLAQRRVMTQFPDHFWAYRKSLKEQLQERPRQLIVQMKHELHPDDERRQQYLESLGTVATATETTLEQLRDVARFAEPFDPLVTPFVSRELAQLCPKVVGGADAAELGYWLHSVYYSPGYDRSIRDATAALRVLLDHPETMTDAPRRWDHMNSLLEVLKQRWTLRSQQTSGSRFDAADVAETMEVTQRALRELESSATTAGIDADWAAVRVQVLERTFVRALRSHHAEQTARQEALERHQKALEATRSVSR